MNAIVTSITCHPIHSFPKPSVRHINLLSGLGVEGDAHLGKTAERRSRVAKDPTQPNLRQSHLIHQELFAELVAQGFDVAPGQMGKSSTTQNIDLLSVPHNSKLTISNDAVIQELDSCFVAWRNCPRHSIFVL